MTDVTGFRSGTVQTVAHGCWSVVYGCWPVVGLQIRPCLHLRLASVAPERLICRPSPQTSRPKTPRRRSNPSSFNISSSSNFSSNNSSQTYNRPLHLTRLVNQRHRPYAELALHVTPAKQDVARCYHARVVSNEAWATLVPIQILMHKIIMLTMHLHPTSSLA